MAVGQKNYGSALVHFTLLCIPIVKFFYRSDRLPRVRLDRFVYHTTNLNVPPFNRNPISKPECCLYLTFLLKLTCKSTYLKYISGCSTA